MAKQNILVGEVANDKTGDTLRNAFVKANANFTELYTLTGGSAADLRELAQDYAAPLFNHASHTNITATYDDANNKILLTGSAAQVQSNWTATTGLGVILNKPSIPTSFDSLVNGAYTVSLDSNGVLTTAVNITLSGGAVIKDTAGNAVAFGEGAGTTSQGASAVAIGLNAGTTTQGQWAVAIGNDAGNGTQGSGAVAIGVIAGQTTQGGKAVAVGYGAGANTQGPTAVAVGFGAGQFTQGSNAVAIGESAGNATQGSGAVAVGFGAGKTSQVALAVAIGSGAGETSQGSNAVAIGYRAGRTSQAANTIILNATGSAVDGVAAQTNSFYVSPIRTATATSDVLYYNTTTKEITYAAAGSVSSLVNGARTVSLGSDGTLTAPGNLQVDGGKVILNSAGNAYVESVDYGVDSANSALNIFGGPYQKIKLRAGFGTQATWTLGTDGSLTFPNATVQTTAYTGIPGPYANDAAAAAANVAVGYPYHKTGTSGQVFVRLA